LTADSLKIIVQKFGGTSVDSAEHRLEAARRVSETKARGLLPVVVVSAIGRAGEPYATDTLLEELRKVDPLVAPSPREQDLILACGEIISTVIMAQAVKALGHETIALTGGQAGIITDYSFGNARIVSIEPGYILYCLEQGKIPVVTGFQGVTERPSPRMHGAITTLGRGGSDTTASSLGYALGARAVEIYTDVDGVKTADPKLVPTARTLETVSYHAVSEMSHLGATVLNPRAAEIAMKHSIPLRVKSTFGDGEGTLIANLPRRSVAQLDEMDIVAAANSPRVAYFVFRVDHPGDLAVVEDEIYTILGDQHINVYLVSRGARSFAFAVRRTVRTYVEELLDALVVPVGVERKGGKGFCGRLYLFEVEGRTKTFEAQRQLLKKTGGLLETRVVKTKVEDNCAIVSLIAQTETSAPGILAQLARSMDRAGVEMLQLSTSPMSISCLVRDQEVGRAVSTLHRDFIEARWQPG
jgi:aspartate kinase